MNSENIFVLASKNKHKAGEIQAILGKGFDVITMDAAGAGEIDVVEDGETFEENAIKKAETIMRATNKPTIADDSGLCVDALGGEPGVYSARYSGENATDEENNAKLLNALDGVARADRTARFVCVIAFARPGEDTVVFRGECGGIIGTVPAGSGGFGYDPLFYVERYNMTMGELEPQVKNEISHRSAAIKKFVAWLCN